MPPPSPLPPNDMKQKQLIRAFAILGILGIVLTAILPLL